MPSILETILNKFSIQKQIQYNNFADKRCMCCIRNFGDVISNIGFAIAGLYHIHTNPILFILAFLVCIGSTYFHWNPTMKTLYWDRFTMILLLNYLIHLKLNLNFFITTVIGIFVLEYWKVTMNLIPYSIYQITPVLIFIYDESIGMRTSGIIYLLAKLCEDNDYKIYTLTRNTVSGHTIKHLLAAMALIFIT